jgi:nucleolysin TIA-1/TIAR
MPQPATGGANIGLTGTPQQGVADPNAAAAGQAGQAQWGGADPNSYYSNYWGGYYGQQAAAGQQGAADASMPGQA